MDLPDNNDRELMLAILQDLPDGRPFDELLRVLAFHRLITRGQHDVAQNRMVDTAGLRQRIKSWRS